MRTIDSVCAEIARSLPVLSGSGGGQTPVEDAAPLYREAARRTLMQLGGNDASLNEALRTVLLHRDGNLAECERLLAEMLPLARSVGRAGSAAEQELDDAYLDGTVLPQLERALELAICAGLTRACAERAERYSAGSVVRWQVRWGMRMDTRESLRRLQCCAGLHRCAGRGADASGALAWH